MRHPSPYRFGKRGGPLRARSRVGEVRSSRQTALDKSASHNVPPAVAVAGAARAAVVAARVAARAAGA
eukprot:8382949-Pyramimonas_sp.AAC.1